MSHKNDLTFYRSSVFQKWRAALQMQPGRGKRIVVLDIMRVFLGIGTRMISLPGNRHARTNRLFPGISRLFVGIGTPGRIVDLLVTWVS